MNELAEVRGGFCRSKIADYAKFTPGVVARCERLAKVLRGKTVIHVNATPVGGGVVEILRSQIPLERSLGIDSRWLVIKAEPDFFVVTKKIHNLFQGKPGRLSLSERRTYLRVNRDLAASLIGYLKKNGIKECRLVVHDPQPLAMIEALADRRGLGLTLRLHIDFTTANPDAVAFFRPFIVRYRRLILSSVNYLPAFRWFPKRRIDVIQPAIDPFSDKNRDMSPADAGRILRRYGLDPRRPIMTQVSRFDPWKGPLGVIEAYRQIKRRVPDLQLVMAGFMAAKDDPEAIEVYKRVEKAAGGDTDIFLFSDPRQLKGVTNDLFINALNTASTVMVQNSSREGFGLTMTEAMWHGKPLAAGPTAGARLQIVHGRNGLLAGTSDKLAALVLGLIEKPALRRRLGSAARASVKRKFLLSHYVLANLRSYLGVSG